MHGPDRLDELKLHTALVSPLVQRSARKLGSGVQYSIFPVPAPRAAVRCGPGRMTVESPCACQHMEDPTLAHRARHLEDNDIAIGLDLASDRHVVVILSARGGV